MFEKGIETLKKVENVLLPFAEEYGTLKIVRRSWKMADPETLTGEICGACS